MGLGAIEGVEDGDAIFVAVFAGEDGGAAGCADGIFDETIAEAHAFPGEAIHVGSDVDLAAVGADGVGGVIIGHDKEDVWAGGVGGVGGEGDAGEGDEQERDRGARCSIEVMRFHFFQK